MRKPFPFALDRSSPDSYRHQIVEGVHEALRGGCYAPGDVLPSLRTAAESLGVSDIVVRGAYRDLSAEGLNSMGTDPPGPKLQLLALLVPRGLVVTDREAAAPR